MIFLSGKRVIGAKISALKKGDGIRWAAAGFLPAKMRQKCGNLVAGENLVIRSTAADRRSREAGYVTCGPYHLNVTIHMSSGRC
jgi:hypothetical protein